MIKRFEDFTGLITSINKDIQKIKSDKMKKFGLNGSDVMCLFYLSRHEEGLTASQLCKLIDVDKAAASRTLSGLLKKGYISYDNDDSEKKYRVEVVLTQKGKEATLEIDSMINDIVEQIGDGIESEERKVMYRSLKIISKNLKNLSIKQGDEQ